MASIREVWPHTRTSEGGWTQDRNDSGNKGPLGTYRGITQSNWPKWSGWAFLATQEYQQGKIFPELEDAVLEFYDKEFWAPMRGDEIIELTTAALTFDEGVNKGMTTSIKITQQGAGIEPTGIMDDATLNAINHPTL